MSPLTVLAIAISKTVNWAHGAAHTYRMKTYPNVARTAKIGVRSRLNGPIQNLYIGEHSYINEGNLSWGLNSSVTIGSGCAIGYNVSIKAITHSQEKPTTNAQGPSLHEERDIFIGNDVWVGDNVFIREGVHIGDACIIGANSVVTRSFPSRSVIAGVPAQIIRSRC